MNTTQPNAYFYIVDSLSEEAQASLMKAAPGSCIFEIDGRRGILGVVIPASAVHACEHYEPATEPRTAYEQKIDTALAEEGEFLTLNDGVILNVRVTPEYRRIEQWHPDLDRGMTIIEPATSVEPESDCHLVVQPPQEIYQVENPMDKPFEDVPFGGAERGEDETKITPEDRLGWVKQALKMMSNPSIQFAFGGVLTDTIMDALTYYSEELQSAIEIRDFDNGPEEEDEDKDAWKQRVIAHDVAVMQTRGWQGEDPDAPVALPKPARKSRLAVTQAPHLTIGIVKGAFKRAIEYLRLLEMLHEGQYEYVGSEDEHTYDGKPHEGCFNCLSYYTAARYLLDMLDRMGSMGLALFDVPGREEDLVEAIQLYAWATHRVDRQEMGDNYLREGQEEVYDYAAEAVNDIYRRSREMWILTSGQEANEISIELKDRLNMEFARTYLEETHRYQEWCQAYLKNKGKVPYYRF